MWCVDPGSNHNFNKLWYPTEEAARHAARNYPIDTRVYEEPDDRRIPRHEEEASASVLTDTTTPLTAVDICFEAARLVGGARAVTHGAKSQNFENTAKLWDAYINAKVTTHNGLVYLDSRDVGNMMELFKIARRLTGSFNIDDYVDAAGYAACTGEIAAAQDAAK